MIYLSKYHTVREAILELNTWKRRGLLVEALTSTDVQKAEILFMKVPQVSSFLQSLINYGICSIDI